MYTIPLSTSQVKIYITGKNKKNILIPPVSKTANWNDSVWFLIFFLEIVNYEFDRIDLLCLAISSAFGVWYLWKKVRSNIRLVSYSSKSWDLL